MAVKLVTPPSLSQVIRDKLLVEVMQLQAEVAAGDVVELFAVVKHANGEWSAINSGSLAMPDMIGRLEIAKWKAVRHYLENDE